MVGLEKEDAHRTCICEYAATISSRNSVPEMDARRRRAQWMQHTTTAAINAETRCTDCSTIAVVFVTTASGG